MAIALSKYIYPLEKPLQFFKEPNYFFDNPRTKEEIELVKEFISKTYQFETKEKGVVGDAFRLLYNISELKKYLEKKSPEDYVLKYYNSNKEKMLLDILAETWIVVRFEDGGEFEKFVKDKEQIFQIAFLRQQTTYADNYEKLLNIAHLLSVLANDDSNYHGESFLLTRNPYSIFYSIERHEIHDVLENFNGMNSLMKHANRAKNWLYWNDGMELIFKASDKLLSLYHQPAIPPAKNSPKKSSQKQTPEQKLQHVGKHLKMSYSHISDPELNLILLVGIFEFLITRQPDTNRFNVEDSIVKQFRLKCSMLIHAQDKNVPIEEISKQLELIYSKRSDFAHGNYVDGYDPKITVELVLLLFSYLKKVLDSYIADRQLVEYLKDN